jgi:hypothetical protein
MEARGLSIPRKELSVAILTNTTVAGMLGSAP